MSPELFRVPLGCTLNTRGNHPPGQLNGASMRRAFPVVAPTGSVRYAGEPWPECHRENEPVGSLQKVEGSSVRRMSSVLLVALCVVSSDPIAAQDVQAELLDLHRRLVHTQMIDRDATFLRAHSLPSYTVVAPGGVIENREQVVAGLRAFTRVDSISMTREQVVFSGDIALVLARLEIHGEIEGPAGSFGPTTTSTTFVRGEDGRWLAAARSLTPCHPRAIQAGRC